MSNNENREKNRNVIIHPRKLIKILVCPFYILKQERESYLQELQNRELDPNSVSVCEARIEIETALKEKNDLRAGFERSIELTFQANFYQKQIFTFSYLRSLARSLVLLFYATAKYLEAIFFVISR